MQVSNCIAASFNAKTKSCTYYSSVNSIRKDSSAKDVSAAFRAEPKCKRRMCSLHTQYQDASGNCKDCSNTVCEAKTQRIGSCTATTKGYMCKKLTAQTCTQTPDQFRDASGSCKDCANKVCSFDTVRVGTCAGTSNGYSCIRSPGGTLAPPPTSGNAEVFGNAMNSSNTTNTTGMFAERGKESDPGDDSASSPSSDVIVALVVFLLLCGTVIIVAIVIKIRWQNAEAKTPSTWGLNRNKFAESNQSFENPGYEQHANAQLVFSEGFEARPDSFAKKESAYGFAEFEDEVHLCVMRETELCTICACRDSARVKHHFVLD